MVRLRQLPNSYRSLCLAAQNATYSSLSQEYATDLKCQQAENNAGYLVGNQYYNCSQPGEDTSNSGPGFALGSLPYNTKPCLPKCTRSNLTPMSMPQQPAEDYTLPSPQQPIQSEVATITSAYEYFEHIVLFAQGYFLKFWEMLLGIGACVGPVVQFLFTLSCSFFQSIASTIVPKIRAAATLFCYVLLFLCAGMVFYFIGTFSTHLVKETTPLKNSFVFLDPAIDDSPNSKYDELEHSYPVSKANWNVVKNQLASKNLDIDALMGEAVYLADISEVEQVQEIKNKIFNFQDELQALGQGNVWASKRVAASKEVQELIKQHAILDFSAVDPQTGSFCHQDHSSFQLSSSTLPILTSAAQNINHVYVLLLTEWWKNKQTLNWKQLLSSLKDQIHPIAEDVVATLLLDAQNISGKQPTFIMSIHYHLMKNSLLAKSPVLSKILGDHFAILAIKSLSGLLQAPAPQNRIPKLKDEHILGLRTSINYVSSKSYHLPQINFADERQGAHIVYPDTLSFSPLSSDNAKSNYSKLDVDHVLRVGMNLGKCWAFAPEGGKLSFRLPIDITPIKLILHHPSAAQELPPSNIKFLAHVPGNDWSTIVESDLIWIPSGSSSLSATLDLSQTNILASHYRLMTHLSEETTKNLDFGCLYKIELQGLLPAAVNSYTGFH